MILWSTMLPKGVGGTNHAGLTSVMSTLSYYCHAMHKGHERNDQRWCEKAHDSIKRISNIILQGYTKN
jgi:hypothetical protein